MMRRIGIIGGMGPQATILMMQKLLDAVQARDDADHIPLIVDQNPQVPSRIGHLLDGRPENPGPVLADMARRLVASGAEALAMPCNTAHHYAAFIRDAVTVPFLDMIDLSVAYAAQHNPPNRMVGILASPAVRKAGVFDAALAKFQLVGIYASDEAAMLTAIRQIKAEGPQQKARQTLQAASKDLLARGAGIQMIACTELSLIADSVTDDALVFDTLDRLVETMKTFALDKNPAQKLTTK